MKDQRTYFQKPLQDAMAALKPAELEAVRDALGILGTDPTYDDLDRYFRLITRRVAPRGRMKRAFWSMAADARRLDIQPPPLRVMTSGRILPNGYPCVYCGAPATDIDHVWPRSRGGDDHPNNLVRSCGRCNTAKHNRSILPAACPSCGHERHPSDVDTATGRAFYACRCGSTWTRDWNLQAVPFAA